MFKKILAVLLVITTFLSFTGFSPSSSREEEIDLSTPEAKIEQSVLQYPATNDDFRYDVYTYYIKITECLSTKSNLIIPDTIQDLPVYIIGNNALADQTTITSVTMTNNIIEIGERAFKDCVNLKSVNVSNNLKWCGANAFAGCNNLKAITLPGTLEYIPGSMFYNCERLTSVIIEDNTNVVVDPEADTSETGRYINASAFGNCPMLKNVWIPMDIIEIENSAFNRSTDYLTIYGEAQSAAAYYASENLVDFTVLDKNSFKNIMSSSIATEIMDFGTYIESDFWKISFEGAYTFRDRFSYYTGGKTKEKILNNGNEVIVLCFAVKNQSQSRQFFNILDVAPTANDYTRKTSSFGKIGCPQMAKYNQPLVGNIESGETMYGYIAIETTPGWESAGVQFMNDTLLESYSFKIKSTDKNMNYIGSVNIPTEEPVEESSTIENPETSTAPEENSTVPEESTASTNE